MCVEQKGCVLLMFAGGRLFSVAMEGGVGATIACDRSYVLVGEVILQAPPVVEINVDLSTDAGCGPRYQTSRCGPHTFG